MYWRYSIYELTDRVKLKLGFETSVILAQHAALVDVANALFADPSKKPQQGLPPNVNDVTRGMSYDGAIGNMNRILNFG